MQRSGTAAPATIQWIRGTRIDAAGFGKQSGRELPPAEPATRATVATVQIRSLGPESPHHPRSDFNTVNIARHLLSRPTFRRFRAEAAMAGTIA
jgi:hypothetical protein